MLVQTLGGALLEGMLLTQLLEKALLPGQPHLGQGGDGAAAEGQPPEGRAQEQGVPLQDAPHGPSGRAGRGWGSTTLASLGVVVNFTSQRAWAAGARASGQTLFWVFL